MPDHFRIVYLTGTCFFTRKLLQRRNSDRRVRHMEGLRAVVKSVKARHPDNDRNTGKDEIEAWETKCLVPTKGVGAIPLGYCTPPRDETHPRGNSRYNAVSIATGQGHVLHRKPQAFLPPLLRQVP